MEIRIVKSPIPKEEVMELARAWHGDMVKAVADIEKETLALGGEYHMDANVKLIQSGSSQNNIWGFNIYPLNDPAEKIQFTSLINIRPKEGNRSIELKDDKLRLAIRKIVDKLIIWN